MAKNTASPSDRQIIDAADQRDPPVAISPAQLHRWRKAKLIRSPGRSGAGSRTPDYSDPEVVAAVELAARIQRAPTMAHAAVSVFNDGYPVPEEGLRQSLLRLLDELESIGHAKVSEDAEPNPEPFDIAAGVASEIATARRPGPTARHFRRETRRAFKQEVIDDPSRRLLPAKEPGEKLSRPELAEHKQDFVWAAAFDAIAPALGHQTAMGGPEHLIAGLEAFLTQAMAPEMLSDLEITPELAGEISTTLYKQYQLLSDLPRAATTIDLALVAAAAEDLRNPTGPQIFSASSDEFDTTRLLLPLMVAHMIDTVQETDPESLRRLHELGSEGENP